MLGNDGKDIDSNENFPNDSDDKTEYADNMLTIGALNFDYGDKVVAGFSNIGKVNVYAQRPPNANQCFRWKHSVPSSIRSHSKIVVVAGNPKTAVLYYFV
jgi:hypothetical protein